MSDSQERSLQTPIIKKGVIKEGTIRKDGTYRLPTNPNARNPFVHQDGERQPTMSESDSKNGSSEK